MDDDDLDEELAKLLPRILALDEEAQGRLLAVIEKVMGAAGVNLDCIEEVH